MDSEQTEKIGGDIIWAERSHSPPNVRDYQRADNLLKWKKLNDWAKQITIKNDKKLTPSCSK